MTKRLLLFGIATVMAFALACGEQASTPAAPSPAVSGDTAAAAADGSTLKATAPAPQQPANGSTIDSLVPNFVLANSTLKFLGDVALTASFRYKINVETPAGVQVHAAWATPQAGTDLSAHRIPAGVLQADTSYRWRTRAELGSNAGPWSAYWTFRTPKSGAGLPSYQNATELWDNLADGKTIGTLVGGAQFVAGKGVLLPSFESRVTYTLQSPLTSGSIEFLVEGLASDSNGGNTKLISMQQGYTDPTDNPYRFNVEKRGDDHVDVGKYWMRIVTGSPAEGGFFDSPSLLPSSPLAASKVYLASCDMGRRRGDPQRPGIVGDGCAPGVPRLQLPGDVPPEPARGAHRRAGTQGRSPGGIHPGHHRALLLRVPRWAMAGRRRHRVRAGPGATGSVGHCRTWRHA